MKKAFQFTAISTSQYLIIRAEPLGTLAAGKGAAGALSWEAKQSGGSREGTMPN